MSDFSSALESLKRSASSASGASSSQSKRQRNDNDNRRVPVYSQREEALRKALLALPHYRSSPSPQPCNKHVCLLFITIDELPFEDIWREWSTSDNSVTVSIIVHAKFPNKVTSDFVKQRLLVQPPQVGRGRESYAPPTYHTRRPEWGSIEITRAMLDLLFEGLKIGRPSGDLKDERFSSKRFVVNNKSTDTPLPPVDKFIFCSETCIPVTTLQETATALFGKDSVNNNISWVNGRNTPNNGYSRQMQFEKVDRVVPKNCIYKADQWIILSRPHAEAVMSNLDRNLPSGAFLWQCFSQTKASDELYFPTALSLLGIMPSSPELEIRRVTYADWSESARNPASFSKGVEDLKRVAPIARKEGCLFARKFVLWDPDPETTPNKDTVPPGGITVEQWKECIIAMESESKDESKEEKQDASEAAAAESSATSDQVTETPQS